MSHTACRYLVLTLLLVLSNLHAHAQNKGPNPGKPRVPFKGSQAFRHILDIQKLQPIGKLEDVGKHPSTEILLIVFGDLRPLDQLDEHLGSLKVFLNNGGNVLLASDHADMNRLGELNMRIHGNTIQQQPHHAYRQIRELPLVTSYIGTRHPLFTGLKKGLATNRPSSVGVHPEADWHRLAHFTNVEPDEMRIMRKWPPACIVGSSSAAPPGGRLIVIGGHGIFMNGMMGQQDNDNFAFAHNTVRWLTEDGPRRHVLFYEESELQTNFKVALTNRPRVPIPPLERVQEFLHKLEKEDIFNKAANFTEQQLMRWMGRQAVFFFVLVLLSLWLAWRGLRHLFGVAYHQERDAPSLQAAGERVRQAPPALVQRVRDATRAGSYAELAQMLAQQWLGLHAAASLAQEQRPLVARSAGSARALQRDLDLLWQHACAAQTAAVDAWEAYDVIAALQRLERAVASGKLIWQPLPVLA